MNADGLIYKECPDECSNFVLMFCPDVHTRVIVMCPVRTGALHDAVMMTETGQTQNTGGNLDFGLAAARLVCCQPWLFAFQVVFWAGGNINMFIEWPVSFVLCPQAMHSF